MNATMQTKTKSHVIIVDDHPVLCDGLKQLIDDNRTSLVAAFPTTQQMPNGWHKNATPT